MKTLMYGAALMLGVLLAGSAVASNHFHVDHEHDHTRYQPPPQSQGDASGSASDTAQHANS
ncbi:hypothetical protein FAZ95_06485 [Trinickia violacea]|uniref:Uncharacterized protein n=1 Tax=Trinickia violacea TaxID=2571746 RepID=A0A4P8IPE1_9BURK|nr:hypothetical protein [Trinickia violacea]QCP48863.1 hypothetical protein FAZ95_06485 [Trinickia violacea]